MKILRIWLLVVLAVLLPVRGAMAAAMACTSSPNIPMGQLHQEHSDAERQGHDHAGHHGGEHQHAHGADHMTVADTFGHDGGQHHDQSTNASHKDKCNLCSASCSMTPLLTAETRLPEPRDLSSVAFPDLGAPAPSFLSDGQERPPRTI